MVALGQRSCLNAESILTLLGSFSRRLMGFQYPMSRKTLATANKHPPREGAGETLLALHYADGTLEVDVSVTEP